MGNFQVLLEYSVIAILIGETAQDIVLESLQMNVIITLLIYALLITMAGTLQLMIVIWMMICL